jgi:hypothetical protein
MITFKTLTPKTATVKGEQNPTTDILYYTIEGAEITSTYLRPLRAYYYFLDENGNVKVVYETVNTILTSEQFKGLELNLPTFESEVHLQDNVKQRLNEMFIVEISQSSPYGTTPQDWEVC